MIKQNSEWIEPLNFIHIGTELADTNQQVKTSMDQYLTEIYMRFVNLLRETEPGRNDSEFRAKHLLGLYITIMSFCLIQTEAERERYITNGLNLIISKDA